MNNKLHANIFLFLFPFVIYFCGNLFVYKLEIDIDYISPKKFIYINSCSGVFQLGLNLNRDVIHPGSTIELDSSYVASDISKLTENFWEFHIWHDNDESIVSFSYTFLILFFYFLIGIISVIWRRISKRQSQSQGSIVSVL
jgi:hypothetical protein